MKLLDIQGNPVEKGATVCFKGWVFAEVTDAPAIASPGPGGVMVVTYRFQIIMPIPEQKGMTFVKMDDLLVVSPPPPLDAGSEGKSIN